MSSKPVHIGFQGLYPQQRKSYIGFEGFEKEYDDDIPRNYPSGIVGIGWSKGKIPKLPTSKTFFIFAIILTL